MIVLKCTKNKKQKNTKHSYYVWYDHESIIYGLMVQFRPMGLYDEAL